MKLTDLKKTLRANAEKLPRFILPDGDQIAAHAHITEVGYAVNTFIDCGGVLGKREAVLLQTHVMEDTDHRLTAERFAKILDLGDRILPHDDLDVEVEYDCCVVAQYPISKAQLAGDHLDLILGNKRTQCLARERAAAEDACCAGSGCS